MAEAEDLEAGLTRDGFLGGRLTLLQPAHGYRAGIDPVLLAAAVPARPGDSVLDLGCGVGTALFCLAARVPGLALAGVEKQETYAALARRNAQENGLAATVVTADIAALPAALRQMRFDHVLVNPPYHSHGTRVASGDAGREVALAGDTPFALWCEIAARRVRPGGTVTMIQAAERLPDLLAALGTDGAVTVRPLAARHGRDPARVIVTMRRCARAGFRLCDASLLHDGERHEGDRESYTREVGAILRHAAAWTWTG